MRTLLQPQLGRPLVSLMICPTCFKNLPADVTTCPDDGAALVPDETFAHVDRELASGTVVGEYRVESKIGEGGFGAVYRAVHPLIGKLAAIKILARQFSSNAQMVSRFVAEARAVNQIGHRNIIDIFSFGQLPDGRQYYIMELLEGETFAHYIAKHGRLSMDRAVPILRGIARALDAAHAKGILHRDLKPENVFLVFDEDDNIQPKLLDFGLVKLVAETTGDHKTKTGTPMGTPYYMSPEQCRGLEVDPRTDVYSFGAMVFEVLTGAPPFDGTSTMDILFKHMSAQPPAASDRAPDLRPEVDAVIARMLAKEPMDRPSGVGEALDLLARAGGIEPSTSPASARSLGSPSPDLVERDRALAQTVQIESAVLEKSSPAVAPRVKGVGSETFLEAEGDVVQRRPLPRSALVAAAIGLMAIGGVGFYLLSSTPKERVVSAASASATPLAAVSSVAIGARSITPSAAPLPAEVVLRIIGTPEAIVSVDGVEIGKTPGPFKVKARTPVRLAFVAKGYKTKEVTMTFVQDTLDFAMPPLERLGAVTPPVPHPKASATINPDLEGFDKK